MHGCDLKSSAYTEGCRFSGAENPPAGSAPLPIQIFRVHCEEVTKTRSVHTASVVSDLNLTILGVDGHDHTWTLAGINVLQRVDDVLPDSGLSGSKELGRLQDVATDVTSNSNRIWCSLH
jgi:hypothetical protein